jgi:hypothetical protein
MVESVPKLVLAAVFSAMLRLFTYTLVNNTAAYFAIDGNTLKLAKTVDYETTKNLSITIKVTDANLISVITAIVKACVVGVLVPSSAVMLMSILPTVSILILVFNLLPSILKLVVSLTLKLRVAVSASFADSVPIKVSAT